MTNQFEALKTRLKSTTEQVPLDKIAFLVARSIIQENGLDPEIKDKLITVARAWGEYVNANNVISDDLFSVRWHIGRFAQQYFRTPEFLKIELKSASIDSLKMPSGQLFTEHIKKMAGDNVFDNPDVALFGGVCRLALKLLAVKQGKVTGADAEELINAELPINDVDIILNKRAVTSEGQFNADLAGTRIVNDIATDMQSVLQNSDCTFNQSIIHGSKLYYAEGALEDASNGTIVFTNKEDALFGAEVDVLKDGKKYINRKGLYRAFAYLLRGKAKQFPIHKENLELEVPLMERYWIILLVIKILSMKDETKRNRAINNWFNLAKKLKTTDVQTPKDFLQELLFKLPDMRGIVAGKGQISDDKFESQVRWLAKKLVNQSIDKITNPDGNMSIQSMSDEQVVINESFFGNERHNTQELLDFIDSLKDTKY